VAQPSLPHPDAVTGTLSELLQWLAPPVQRTLDDLEVYHQAGMAGFFPLPVGLPEVRTERRWSLPGLTSDDLVFESLHEPLEPAFASRYRDHYAACHKVFARRVRPRDPQRKLLYLHGYMQPETMVEEVGLLGGLALALNAEVIQLQPPYHGRRRPKGSHFSGQLYWTADLVRSLEALRQSVHDARALLGWMRDRDDRPVGVTGISLGGFLTAVLTCVEERFAFSVPLIAHMDLGALVADAPVLGRMRRDLSALGWQPGDFTAWLGSLGWDELRPLLPPEDIQIFAASQDGFFDPVRVEAMWRRWGEPEIRWYDTSHMGFIPRLPLVVNQMRRFAARYGPDDRGRVAQSGLHAPGSS
jgi:hypothetical protein